MKLRLPPELGGAEFETNYRSTYGTRVTVMVDGVGEIQFPADVLTEVEPPLPPEPPVGSVVLDDKGRAWQRVDTFLSGRGEWRRTYDDLGAEWDELCAVPLILLVPDPLAEPVELPWWSSDRSRVRTGVHLHRGDVVDMQELNPDRRTSVGMTPDTARAKARALWAAANAIEAAS